MYGLVSAKGSAVARRYEVGGPYESWSIRTAFMVPFFPLSLIPLICGCVIVVYDWKADAPWVHYGCMALAFSAAVISYLLFAKLAGWPLRNSRPNKAPEHNALTRE